MHTFVPATPGRVARLIVALAVLALACAAQSPSLATLYSFTGGAGGANPTAGVAFGTGTYSADLFGTTPYGGSAGYGTAFELTPGTTWGQTVLHNFQGGNDGANPGATLTPGKGGVLYGTTFAGGSTGNGTVFKLAPPAVAGGAWTETVLYSFESDAAGTVNVTGTSVSLASGTSFVTGTTWNGSSIYINRVQFTIASVVSSSALTLTAAPTQTQCPAPCTGVNYSMGSAPAGPWAGWPDGSGPQGGVVLLNNKLYGTTSGGGTTGAGAVFQLTPPAGGTGSWTETVIYNFKGGKDGSGPQSGVIVSKGDLYGTTCCGTVGGTIYKLAPPTTGGGAWSKQSVFSFTAYFQGDGPFGPLAIDANGVLYGTTTAGGSSGAGIVFSLTPPATKGKPYTLATIHAFTGGTDGGAPYGGLTLGSNGVLYATVTVGCSSGVGGILEFTPPTGGSGPWTETVLYNFTGAQDGSQPFAGVLLGSNNALYGTTVFSNYDLGYGTVFELTQ